MPTCPVITVRTLQDQAALNVNDERVAMIIALTLAGAALLLAAVGLYGSMSDAVRQRTRELGVRLALGATVADIRRLVLGHGLRLCAVGTVLGSVAAHRQRAPHRAPPLWRHRWRPATLLVSAAILCDRGPRLLDSRAPRHARRSRACAAFIKEIWER